MKRKLTMIVAVIATIIIAQTALADIGQQVVITLQSLSTRIDQHEERIKAIEQSLAFQEYLTGIKIEPENRCTEYDRSDYHYSQRIEISIVAYRLAGRIYGPYTGTYFNHTGETDIEHIVARSEAHDSGLCSEPRETKRQFASDLDNLTLASPQVNRYEKRDKDIAEWLPEKNDCWYVNRVIEVKRKYGLSMDRAEAEKAVEVMQTCTNFEMQY